MGERLDAAAPHLHYRTCHLCEALCGIEVEVTDGAVTALRGDQADPFSRGHICPKAAAIPDLQSDPDRLRSPVRKASDGSWAAVSWEEAFEDIAAKLTDLRQQKGPDSIAFYNGNPGAHNYGLVTHAGPLSRLLKTKNRYSATSVDQLPHHLAGLKLYGHQSLMPVPDVDHTDLWIILGGNPAASNGSIMTVPDVRNRIKAIIKRGGEVITIDPRRTETSRIASEHIFITPGSDAALLAAIVHTLFAQGLLDLGPLEETVTGLDALRDAVQHMTPQRAARVTGVDEAVITALAQKLANTPRAALYGRMGVSVQRFGALCQYLIQAINILTGHLDSVGGMMLPRPAVDIIPHTNPGSFDRRRSRVEQLPEFSGEFPASTLASEILEPGDGQVRALITIAGNPVLSTPGGHKLDAALETLDFMISIDMYVTETTRHADYILPPTGPLEKDHFGLFFHALAVRNTVKYSPPTLPKSDGALHDWEILEKLARAVAQAMGTDVKSHGTPTDFLDRELRRGPYNLSLDELKARPHGIDLGPLEPCLPDRLFTADKKIALDQAFFLDDLNRVEAQLLADDLADDKESAAAFRLIGRRHIRSNNSWLHNSNRLVKGPPRCTALLHPDDAARLKLAAGDDLRITSRAGEIVAQLEITEDIMPGVVSVPHGWGHHRKGVGWALAAENAGVSVNDVTDPGYYDQLSGNAAVNGVPVELAAA